ncbi:hypothetical protein CPB83DRAFT_858369 [Crepidotus variabilis]|uniref:Uncharacterized protein n=1 Tax=Crepidotus variabilis TaxID=179855 RepID=A0A9P6EBN8_9AGAR|nr:hypothetical protein CPB83DRAFT_858369 [Crepidotus variabilis]
MFANGSLAVAIVRNQVMIVQAAREHTKRDKFVDVRTYTPFGAGVFLASEVPSARIASSAILTVLPPVENTDTDQGMLELSEPSFSRFIEHSSRHTKRHESLWNAWVSKN